MVMNVEKIREDFPILDREVNGKPLVYLDNAATSQKPVQVIDSLREFYEQHNANVHRGVHKLSQEASELYEKAHDIVGKFINAGEGEIVFTTNATQALNMAARMVDIKKGERVVTTVMEHHSNYIPWMMAAEEVGASVDVVDITDERKLDMEALAEAARGAKVIAITHVSNAIGTINDIKEVGKIAHENDALLVVDGAQSVPHMKVDVRRMDCDLLAFSGHKMLGPTGTGALFGKKDLLEKSKPVLGGGGMVSGISDRKMTFSEVPWRFEAGTPNIAGCIALSKAVEYLEGIGMEDIEKHEKELIKFTIRELDAEICGPKGERSGIVSFNVGPLNSHDVAAVLDEKGIAIRSGHHCCLPLIKRLKLSGMARASFYLYNTREEAKTFIESVNQLSSF